MVFSWPILLRFCSFFLNAISCNCIDEINSKISHALAGSFLAADLNTTSVKFVIVTTEKQILEMGITFWY